MNLSKIWEVVEDRRASCLQFMMSQRVGHNLATEKQLYIYIHEYYSDIKKNKIVLSAATWMDLEVIILVE